MDSDMFFALSGILMVMFAIGIIPILIGFMGIGLVGNRGVDHGKKA